MTISPEAAEQAEQALRNIGSALDKAGCGFQDVVRVRYILANRRDFALCLPVLRRIFGAAPPAATMIEAGLIEERIKIEIEVTARLPDQLSG